MRTMLVSVVAFLAQWGMPAQAQQQAGPLPTPPAITSGYFAHPPAKRFFFFKDAGQPTAFGKPAQAPGTGAFSKPYSLRFPPTGLLPLASPPSQDLWRYLKPKNTRLFFFTKP